MKVSQLLAGSHEKQNNPASLILLHSTISGNLVTHHILPKTNENLLALKERSPP